MSKSHTIKRSAKSERFVTKPIGREKASKFSAVEGIILNERAAVVLQEGRAKGLKGDALRSSVTGSFVNTKKK